MSESSKENKKSEKKSKQEDRELRALNLAFQAILDYTQLIEVIRRAIEARGGVSSFAKKSKINAQTFYRIFSFKTNLGAVSAIKIEAIIKALGYKLDWMSKSQMVIR